MKINYDGVEVILKDDGKGYGYIKANNGAKFETFNNKLTLSQLIWIIELVAHVDADEKKAKPEKVEFHKPFKIKKVNNIVFLQFNGGVENKYYCPSKERAIQFEKELDEAIEFLKYKNYQIEYQKDAVRFYGKDIVCVVGCMDLVYGDK